MGLEAREIEDASSPLAHMHMADFDSWGQSTALTGATPTNARGVGAATPKNPRIPGVKATPSPAPLSAATGSPQGVSQSVSHVSQSRAGRSVRYTLPESELNVFTNPRHAIATSLPAASSQLPGSAGHTTYTLPATGIQPENSAHSGGGGPGNAAHSGDAAQPRAGERTGEQSKGSTAPVSTSWWSYFLGGGGGESETQAAAKVRVDEAPSSAIAVRISRQFYRSFMTVSSMCVSFYWLHAGSHTRPVAQGMLFRACISLEGRWDREGRRPSIVLKDFRCPTDLSRRKSRCLSG